MWKSYARNSNLTQKFSEKKLSRVKFSNSTCIWTHCMCITPSISRANEDECVTPFPPTLQEWHFKKTYSVRDYTDILCLHKRLLYACMCEFPGRISFLLWKLLTPLTLIPFNLQKRIIAVLHCELLKQLSSIYMLVIYKEFHLRCTV